MPDQSETSESPQNPAGPGVPRGRRAAAIAGIVGVLGLATYGGLQVHKAASSTDTSCRNPAIVQIAAPDAIEGSIQHAADNVQQSGTVCAVYDVSTQDPGDTYQSILTSSGDEPQVWISDSPMWTDLLNAKLGSGWVTVGPTIATSPVVLGVPASLKSKAESAGTQNWVSSLNNSLPVSFVDTNESSAGLLDVVAANQQSTSENLRSQLMHDVLRLSRSLMTYASLEDLAVQTADKARIFPISEQQLVSFNSKNPSHKMTALVPQGGAQQLQYQWITPVRATPANAAALEALQDELTSPGEQSYRSVQGFRNSQSAPLNGQQGLPAKLPMMPPASPQLTVGADTAWENLKKDARMLVLVDVSSTMQEKVGTTGQTRIGLLEQTAIGALSALPQTTRMGAWAFSTNLQAGHVDYLPLSDGEQPLTNTAYKQALIQRAQTLPQLAQKGGQTGLYDSIAAAYKSVADTYDPNYINSVVVLTGSANNDTNGGLTKAQLIAKLKSEYSISKPVKIVTIDIGSGADPQDLHDIAKVTDGLSYTTTTPDQIASVFVDAFLRRSDY